MDKQKELAEKIRLLEESLLSPETRHSEEDVAGLLSDGFIELGSSGRMFNKEQAVKGLLDETPVRISPADFRVTVLTPEVVLVTYRVTKMDEDGKESRSLRSSIWQLTGSRWQIVFHQGTPLE